MLANAARDISFVLDHLLDLCPFSGFFLRPCVVMDPVLCERELERQYLSFLDLVHSLVMTLHSSEADFQYKSA